MYDILPNKLIYCSHVGWLAFYSEKDRDMDVPPKRRKAHTRLYCVTSHKILLLISLLLKIFNFSVTELLRLVPNWIMRVRNRFPFLLPCIPQEPFRPPFIPALTWPVPTQWPHIPLPTRALGRGHSPLSGPSTSKIARHLPCMATAQ